MLSEALRALRPAAEKPCPDDRDRPISEWYPDGNNQIGTDERTTGTRTSAVARHTKLKFDLRSQSQEERP